ncbi:MAG: DUF6293 family protein [Candidatus Nitrosocaldus sp.]
MTDTLTLHIATFGNEGQEGIAGGIRNFPIHKLVLLCYSIDKQKAEEIAKRFASILGIRVTINVVARENVVRDTMERVSEIISRDGREFQQVLMNISCGDKLLGCAALSAAFVNGIKAFTIDEEGAPILLPILKLSYHEVISDAKLKILRSINDQGGSIESLEQLEQATGYGKPLLSYHLMGSKESKGLVELGLLEVEKRERGRISAKLTTLGKLLVISDSIRNAQP